jgi:membrane-associated phospholipid phosphatase
MKIKFILIAFSLLNFVAKNNVSAQAIRIDSAYLKSYPRDIKSIIKKPFHLNDKEVAIGFGSLASVFIIHQFDADIKSTAQYNRTATGDKISNAFQLVGNGKYCFTAMGALYVTGLVFHKRHIQYTGLQAFKALVLSAGVTGSIKYFTQRERPFETNNPNNFHFIWNTFKYNSFPSGHTSDAFAMASVIGYNVKNKYWQIPIYAIATGVGISRINDNKHWASDVVMGAAIGYCVGQIINRSGNFLYPKPKRNLNEAPRF